jgi:hypothetical protein
MDRGGGCVPQSAGDIHQGALGLASRAVPLQSLTQELLSSIGDSLERLLRIIQAIDVAEPALLPHLDRLAGSLASARNTVSLWANYGSDREAKETEASCRAKIKIVDAIRSGLRGLSTLSSYREKVDRVFKAIRDMESALEVFEGRRKEAWYCLRTTVCDGAALNTISDHSGKQVGRWRDDHLSYCRLTRSFRK